MFVKEIETALWWVPKTWTVQMEGEDRPVVWLAAVGIGMFSAQFVVCKMEEIAQKISATKDETQLLYTKASLELGSRGGRQPPARCIKQA